MVLVNAHLLCAIAAVEFRHDLLVGGLAASSFESRNCLNLALENVSVVAGANVSFHTLALLLQRTLGGMAGLEALLVLLCGAAVMMVSRD